MSQDLLYQIALTRVPNIGPVQAKILLQHFSPADIFKASPSLLEKMEGIGSIRAGSIRAFRDFKSIENEIRVTEQAGIRTVFITDPGYPKRLLHCYDSPTLLYQKGSGDLNASRIVAVIGTRNFTDYGRQAAETLIAELRVPGLMVVSGLAFGIDAIAHRSALKNDIPTVAVLAHGLDQVYPPEHASLAKEIMREGGGLLTEFGIATKPDRHHFPARNRIVAGMSDATIVVETGEKGGSMITAELANGYNRDVFAFPGRATDPRSRGCNQLIRTNKAMLINQASELLELLGWEEKPGFLPGPARQRNLFVEMSPDEKTVFALLQTKQLIHIDELYLGTGLSNSAVAAALLRFELEGIVACLPGKMYSLR